MLALAVVLNLFLFSQKCSSFVNNRFVGQWITRTNTNTLQATTQAIDVPVINEEDNNKNYVDWKSLSVFPSFSDSGGAKHFLTFKQKTSGPIPRSHLETILSVTDINLLTMPASSVNNFIEEALNWYLNVNGRIKNLLVIAPLKLRNSLEEMGCFIFDKTDDNNSNEVHFKFNIDELKKYIISKIASDTSDKSILHNILGRLAHDLGDFKLAIDSYTKALLIKPGSAHVFRNLGSAYHADANEQMAYASYQQAISLDSSDALVYLKLAYLYEDLDVKDWKQSYENAIQCYRYYLDKVDPEDTSVLTRLGNLYMRGAEPEEALDMYRQALALDPCLHVAWFNSAHALIKLGSYEGAYESLLRTLQYDPDNVSAKHMLMALSPDSAACANAPDPEYVRQLFDDYVDDYDKHSRKLRYAAPRVIRTELARIFKEKYEAEIARRTLENKDYVGPSYLTFMERRLDVLDLGCGTGQVGKWLKDYAKALVGIDLSYEMVEKAKSKVLYTDLRVSSIADYLGSKTEGGKAKAAEQFDVVVAADVFGYIGDISDTIAQSLTAVRAGGYLVFTVETGGAVDAACLDLFEEKGFMLQRSGRFAYTKQYVDGILSAHNGLTTVVEKDFALRYDVGEPVPGCLFIVQKE